MSTGGDVSEQVVRDSMIIAEELAKIAGHLAKETLALLAALLQREWQTKGAAPVTSLKNQAIKTGQELAIFQLKKEHIPMFKSLAKEFGVLYHKPIFPPVFLTKDGEALVDMVGLSGDARGINHILEKLGYPVPERDEAKNAEARAASGQNSHERGNGYERSRPSRPNRENEAVPAPEAGEAPGGKGEVPGRRSAVADIRRFKKQAEELKANRAAGVSKTQAGPVR